MSGRGSSHPHLFFFFSSKGKFSSVQRALAPQLTIWLHLNTFSQKTLSETWLDPTEDKAKAIKGSSTNQWHLKMWHSSVNLRENSVLDTFPVTQNSSGCGLEVTVRKAGQGKRAHFSAIGKTGSTDHLGPASGGRVPGKTSLFILTWTNIWAARICVYTCVTASLEAPVLPLVTTTVQRFLLQWLSAAVWLRTRVLRCPGMVEDFRPTLGSRAGKGGCRFILRGHACQTSQKVGSLEAQELG